MLRDAQMVMPRPDPRRADTARRVPVRTMQLGLAAILAALILAADMTSALAGAVAVLYIAVILLVAQTATPRAVLATGIACAALTAFAFVADHFGEPIDSAYTRFGVSLVAITVTTLLSIRDRFTQTTLNEQARILELTHDTVIIRDADDVIRYWNDGAERLYGWTRTEAVGQTCRLLLQDEVDTGAVALGFADGGRWSGELVRRRRDGTRMALASRWLLRQDIAGRRIGVIETSADLTEQRRADHERQVSERRYSTIFHQSGFAIWESDWSATLAAIAPDLAGRPDPRALLAARPELVRRAAGLAVMRDANQAAVRLFGAADRDALVGGNVVARYTREAEQSFLDTLGALFAGETSVETETRFTTTDGRLFDAILRVTLLPEGEPWSRVLVMAFDVTERNQARARLEEAAAELAHAARVSTLGQLAATIAHEVNQPLAAIITYAKSGKRWLGRETPVLDEAASCLDHIVANGNRAASIIAQVRALARKAPPRTEDLDLATLLAETVRLVQREARAAGVAIRQCAAPGTAPARGDRVQVQQVIVNLLMNAIQAMRDVPGRRRELALSLGPAEGGMVRLDVSDSGSGFGDADPDQIFRPFFTTKADGMGMGLSICRSIVEAQGGRIEAANNEDAGATISVSLPAAGAA